MVGVAEVHHALRVDDTAAVDIQIGIDVAEPMNQSTINAHAELDLGLVPQCMANLHGATNRRFSITKETQCHAIPSGRANQSVKCLRVSKLLCTPHYVLKFLQVYRLLLHQQSGKADDIHEEHIGCFRDWL